MKKLCWLIAAAAFTTVAVALISKSGTQVVEAPFAVVERADVHQIIPIFGQLRYADERIISADIPGLADHVCVHEGERVGIQAALVRLEVPAYERILSAFAAGSERFSGSSYTVPMVSVIRAEEPFTIRQVFVEEGDAITPGMPIVRVSSHQQRVICEASPQDAKQISPGMWAWIRSEGEALCTASVESVGEVRLEAKNGMTVQEIVLLPEKQINLPEFAVVDADIYLAGSDDVLSLPLEAITDRETVWWINEEICTEIPAQIVLCDEMRAWVHLPEGMKVAIGEFKNGQRVREAKP